MKLVDATMGYLNYKKSIGMRFRSEAVTLRSFCRSVGDIDITRVTSESVLNFIAGKGAVTTFWHQKFTVLSGFYRHAISRGYVRLSPLPTNTPRRREPMRPYIYAENEIRQILAATDGLKTRMSPLQATTFRTLLLTLYGTGPRIGEALALRLCHVDFADGLLTIHNSKFFKTRLVPFGPQLGEELAAYSKKRSRLPLPEVNKSFFFCTRTGNKLSYERASRTFRKLRKLAGIRRERDARYQPRLHDFRHTFAVHRLVQWYRQGADVQQLLPKLSTFLGHIDVRETQIYLTMIPELLNEASSRFERYARSEVNHG